MDLIDDEFIEIGSSAIEYNKAAVDWLKSNEQSKRTGTHQLSEDLILLTILVPLKTQDTPSSETKYAAR